MNLKWMMVASLRVVPHTIANDYWTRLLVSEPDGKIVAEVEPSLGIWTATIIDGWPSGSIGKYISLERAMAAVDEVATAALKCKEEMVRQLKAQMAPTDTTAGPVQ